MKTICEPIKIAKPDRYSIHESTYGFCIRDNVLGKNLKLREVVDLLNSDCRGNE